MLAEALLILSILAIGAGSYLTYGVGHTLIIVGVYLGVIAFSMAYSKGG